MVFVRISQLNLAAVQEGATKAPVLLPMNAYGAKQASTTLVKPVCYGVSTR